MEPLHKECVSIFLEYWRCNYFYASWIVVFWITITKAISHKMTLGTRNEELMQSKTKGITVNDIIILSFNYNLIPISNLKENSRSIWENSLNWIGGNYIAYKKFGILKMQLQWSCCSCSSTYINIPFFLQILNNRNSNRKNLFPKYSKDFLHNPTTFCEN